MAKATAVDALKWQVEQALGITLDAEYRFHPTRKWRFDLACPDRMVAVEIEGIVWRGEVGRHQRAKGYQSDCEKYNEALILGWRVLRVTPDQVNKGQALAWVKATVDLCTHS